METPMLCPKCGYQWITRSPNIYCTCPNCYRKMNREKNTVRIDDNP